MAAAVINDKSLDIKRLNHLKKCLNLQFQTDLNLAFTLKLTSSSASMSELVLNSVLPFLVFEAAFQRPWIEMSRRNLLIGRFLNIEGLRRPAWCDPGSDLKC